MGSILGAPSPASFFFYPLEIGTKLYPIFVKKILLQILENFTKYDQTQKKGSPNLDKFLVLSQLYFAGFSNSLQLMSKNLQRIFFSVNLYVKTFRKLYSLGLWEPI